MNKGSRFFIIVPALCLALGFAMPVINGVVLEKFVMDHLGGKKGLAGIEILEYDRGFFSSRILWKLKSGQVDALAGKGEVIFLDRADHGLLEVRSRTSLDKNQWFKAFSDRHLNGMAPFDMETRYSVLGRVESRMSVKGFSFDSPRGKTDIKPGRAEISWDKKKGIRGEWTWGGGHFPGHLVSGAMTGDLTFRKAKDRIWDGRFFVRADRLETWHQPLSFEGLCLVFESDFDPKKNLVDFLVQSGFDRMVSGQDRIGDGFAGLEMGNVDANGYQWVTGAYGGAMVKAFSDIVSGPHDPRAVYHRIGQLGEQMGFGFLSQCERLLKTNLRIRVAGLKARIDSGENKGQVRGELALTLKRNMTLAGFIPIMLRPAAILDMFDFSSRASLPPGFEKSNPYLVSPLGRGMETGLFVLDTGGLSHKLETIQGKLFLNNRQVKLE